MSKILKNKGILFDLDGTLWDVLEITYKSVNKIAKKYDLEKIEEATVKKVFGLSKEEVARLYFPSVGLNKALQLFEEAETLNREYLNKYGGNIYDCLEKVLQELNKDYDLFIVSNASSNKYIESFLMSSKTKKYFKDYIAAGEFNISKDEAIKKIIEDYNLKKSVYVGDIYNDMEAAKEVGIPFIHARYGFGKDFKTEYYIDRVKDLPSVIKNIL